VNAVKAEKRIKLADAFRAILRAGWLQRPGLADEIQSIKYFHWAPIDKSKGRRSDPEAQAADEAFAVMRDAIVNQRIRLFGRLGDNLPDDVDPTEVAWNGVHVFDGTIEVYGERGRTLRTYRHVHCYESDVAALIDPSLKSIPVPQPKRYLRYPLDDRLAAEGAAGIPAKWANANKAAIALAPQTEGNLKAKEDRLGRKISKLLETSRNTPKD